MSPLWRDEIGVYLSPTRVILNRMRRGVRPQCVADMCSVVESRHVGDWRAALEVLHMQLTQERWHNANARLVIADSWVRYAIAPWTAELSGQQERLIHARYVLSQLFGEMGTEWQVALGQCFGNSQVVCATPVELISSAVASLESARLHVVSIQPQLVVAFNFWRQHLPEITGWFVSLDHGSLAAAHLSSTGWDRVHSVRIGNDWAVELRRLRTFGRFSNDSAQDGRVFVDAPVWLRKLAGNAQDGLEMLDESAHVAHSTLQKLVALKAVHL